MATAALIGVYSGGFPNWINNSSSVVTWQNNSSATVQWRGQFQLVGSVTSNITVALTGVSSTGAVGTVTAALAESLSGVTGTGSVGSVTPNSAIAITQDAATGSVGTVTANQTYSISNVTGTGAVGSVTAAPNIPLTQVSATGAVGSVSPAKTASLSQVSATGAVGTVTAALSAGVSQVVTTGSVGNVPGGDSDALTGVSATGSVGSVSPSWTVALTNVTGTGAVGTVTASFSIGISQVSATGAVGTVTYFSYVSVALTGVSATGSAGTVTSGNAQAITGVVATGTVGTVSASIYPLIYDSIYNVVNANEIVYPDVEWTRNQGYGYAQTVSQTPFYQGPPTWVPQVLVANLGDPIPPVYVDVPSVVGLKPYDATVALQQIGLTAGSPSYTPSNTVPNGLVISQDKTAGLSVLFGTVVNMVVSMGPPMPNQYNPATVVVPDYTGVTLDAAKVSMINLNLMTGPIIYAASNTIAVNSVISQLPLAGSTVSQGSTVTLTVSMGTHA